MSILKTDIIIPGATDKIQVGFIEEPTRPGHPSTKFYADSRIRGTFNFRGFWDDQESSPYPLEPENRDMYVIESLSTIEGETFLPGDWIIYDDGQWIHISNGSFIAGATVSVLPPLKNVAGVLGMEEASDTSNGYVSIGAQKFAGTKTFATLPAFLGNPIESTDAVSKAYVDAQIAAGGISGSVYHITYDTQTGVMALVPTASTGTARPFRITGNLGNHSVVTLGGASVSKAVYTPNALTIVGPDSSTSAISTDASGNMVISASAVVCSNQINVLTPTESDDVVTKGYLDGQVATIYPAVISALSTTVEVPIDFRCGDLTYMDRPFTFTKAGSMVVAKFPPISFTATLIGITPIVTIIESGVPGADEMLLGAFFWYLYLTMPGDPAVEFGFFSETGAIPVAYRPTQNVTDMIKINNDWGLVQYKTNGDIALIRSRSSPYFIKGSAYVVDGKYTAWSL